jgi:hypothetical protein
MRKTYLVYHCDGYGDYYHRYAIGHQEIDRGLSPCDFSSLLRTHALALIP